MQVDKQQLETRLVELKSDYIRIQSDLEKLAFVKGNENAAEEQLIRLEKEIAEVYEQLEKLDN